MRELRVLGSETAGAEAPAAWSHDQVRFGEGFHDQEHAEGLPFRWMSLAGRILLDAEGGERFLELWVRSNFHDLSQRVELAAGPGKFAYELVHGWNALSLPVPSRAASIALTANRILQRGRARCRGTPSAARRCCRAASVRAAWS